MSIESGAIRSILERIAVSPLPVTDCAASLSLRAQLTPQDSQKLYTTLARRVISEPSNAFNLSKVLVSIASALTPEAKMHLLKSLAVVLKNSDSPKEVYSLFSEVPLVNTAEVQALIAATAKDGSKYKLLFLLDHVIKGSIPLPSAALDEAGSLLTSLVPCLVPGLYEGSNEARIAATDGLKHLAKFVMEQSGQLLRGFMALLIAPLASTSLDFIAGSILALATVLPDLEPVLSAPQLAEIMRTVAAVSMEAPQVMRAVIKLSRVVIKLKLSSIPVPSVTAPTTTLAIVAEMFGGSLLSAAPAQGACRMNVRRLTAKLGKKFGWEQLKALTKPEQQSLVRYVQRMTGREMREAWQRREDKQAKETARKPKKTDADSESEEEERFIAKLHLKRPTKAAEGKFDVAKALQQANTKRGLGDLAKVREARAKGKAKKDAKKEVGRGHNVLGEKELGNKRGDGQKKTQRLAPFAYVRLNPSLAKEKHKRVAVRAFKKVMGIQKR